MGRATAVGPGLAGWKAKFYKQAQLSEPAEREKGKTRTSRAARTTNIEQGSSRSGLSKIALFPSKI